MPDEGVLFIPAFAPDGQRHPAEMPARVAALVAKARSEGFETIGIRLCLSVTRGAGREPDRRPMAIRARRLLKYAGRQLGLRCVDVRERR